MIGRLIRMMQAGMALLVYLSIATVMAQVVVGAYIATNWKINADRWHMMVAIAQGIDIIAMKEEARQEWEDNSEEQLSMEEIREARAVKFFDLELREQAVRNDRSQLDFVQRKVTDESKRFQQIRDALNTELEELQAQANSDGIADNRAKLESIKAKQAKQLLDEMLDADEWDDVVTLLKGMPNTKSAKIITEFKTPDWVWEKGRTHRPDHTIERIDVRAMERLLRLLSRKDAAKG